MQRWFAGRQETMLLGGVLVVAWALYFRFDRMSVTGAAVTAPAATPVLSAPPAVSVQGSAGGMRMEVYVTGAVREPGLYSLPVDARVAAVIARAGGALPSADLAAINLAAVVEDGTQVVVPTLSDATSHMARGQTARRQAEVGEHGQGGAASLLLPESGIQSGTQQTGARYRRAHHKLQPGQRIDVNKASLAQLEELPGIGKERAGAFLAYRAAHGLFTSLSQLGNVPGIGAKELEKLLPYATL